MLQNAYFLAKIGADTAENEQHFAEILPIGRRVADWGVPEPVGLHRQANGEAGEQRVVPLREPAARLRRRMKNAFFENAFFENAFFENFANFWRARSRLYQNEILQENMRSTAFFKLYKICILLHRCNLKILAKNRFEKSAIFVKIQQKGCKCRKICKILPNFKKFS